MKFSEELIKAKGVRFKLSYCQIMTSLVGPEINLASKMHANIFFCKNLY